MKKKILAMILASAMVLGSALTAFAEGEATQSGTQTVTTTVPEMTYTLNIPADVTVEYNAGRTTIGTPYITDASGFTSGPYVLITLNSDFVFKSETTDTTMPYTLFLSLYAYDNTWKGSTSNISQLYTFKACGCNDGTLGSVCPSSMSYDYTGRTLLCIDTDNWSNLKPGVYTTTITYTSEIVTTY